MRLALVIFATLPFVYALARVFDIDAANAVLWPLGRWFAVQCHQLPERGHALLPVCWRCVGLYAGLGIGALVPARDLAGRKLGSMVAVAAALLLVDVCTERMGLRPPSAPLRVLTGLLLAYPIGSRGARVRLGRRSATSERTRAMRETAAR